MSAELNSEQILSLTEEALRNLASTLHARVNEATVAIDAAQVATREARVEALEKSEATAERVVRDMVDPLVQGPLADARTDAMALMDEARAKAGEYKEAAMSALDGFELAWIAVHRCYSVLSAKKFKVSEIVTELFPREHRNPRELCCEGMATELLAALQSVQPLAADGWAALRDVKGFEIVGCRPPPPEVRTTDIAQRAVKDARLATDRMIRMTPEVEEQIALEQAFRELVSGIHEYGNGCNNARSYGVGAAQLLREQRWLPISHEKSRMSAETFDAVKDDVKVNLAALRTTLQRYERRLGGWT